LDDHSFITLIWLVGTVFRSRLGWQAIPKPELDGMRLALPAATRNLAIDGFKEDASSAAASRLHTALRVGIAELAIGWGEVALALRENMVFLPLPDGRSQQRRNPSVSRSGRSSPGW